METKLNVWLSHDLTLMGRTSLVKALGISKLTYFASVLTISEEVIERVRGKLFNFLRKQKRQNKKRGIKLSKGDLNFPNFRTTVKALRLSWISRLLNDSNDAWKAFPNALFNRYGGLAFLLKCNYNTKNLNRNVSSFYLEMLDNFRELLFTFNLR